MDENYYEYFIVGEAGEYSNALLNYPHNERSINWYLREGLVFLLFNCF